MCHYVLVLSDYYRQRAFWLKPFTVYHPFICGCSVTGNAPFSQSHLWHPFIYGSPASPLLSRTPVSKYIPSYKVNSSTSTALFLLGNPKKVVQKKNALALPGLAVV
jgi:hypothetical protein